MAARSGQQYIVDYLRDICLAGTADYTFNGGTYWTDDQLVTILERTAVVQTRIATQAIAQDNGGTLYYYQYQIPHTWFEDRSSGTPYYNVYDAYGSAIGTAEYTLDPINGIMRFADDQGGSAINVDLTLYNMNKAAAEIWRQKAAHISEISYDVTLDGHKLSRSQRVQLYMQMASEYDSHAGFDFIPVVRVDIVGA